MLLNKRTLTILFLIALCAFATAAALGADGLTLSDCVKKALNNSPEMGAASNAADEQKYRKKSSFGMYFPKVMLEMGFNYVKMWGYEDPMLPKGFMAPGIPPYDITLALMPHPDHLYSIKGTVAQPLSYLYTIYLANSIGDEAVELTKLKETLTAQATGMRTVQAFYQVKLAMTAKKIVDQTALQIEAHIKDANNYLEQGLITKGDVLKVEMQQSKVKQMSIEYENNVKMAKANLGTVIGLPAEKINLTEEDEPMAEAPCDLQQCISKGLDNRPELKMLKKQEIMLDKASKVAWMGLVPNIIAASTIQYQDDGSTTTNDYQFTLGLIISWDIWDWGQKYYTAKAEEAKSKGAQYDLKKGTDGISLQIEQAWRNLKVSSEKIEAAKAALTQAEENYRIEKENFAVQKTTSANLMDAESALVQAQMQLEINKFEYRMLWSALKLALGEFPVAGKF